MCKTAVFYGDELARYSFGEAHPFNANRIHAFWSKFCALGLDKADHIQIEKPETTQEETLLRFHDKEYVDLVKKSSKLGTGLLDLGDTPAFRGVFEASSYVVGTSLKALEIVMGKKLEEQYMRLILLVDSIMQEEDPPEDFVFLTILV
jgi:acetoin utilization protein AcuC